jgi:predicted dehydrogenase
MATIGLIGCGNWGKNILRDLLHLQCAVYVADINPLACQRACQMGAAGAYESFELLPPCDGYVVAVLIPDLTRICAALLKFQKPIFSEKTLCLSMDDFNLLKKSSGTKYIFVMHKWHYHPGIETLRQIATSGKIGTIEKLCATRHGWVDDFHGGDVFWTQSVHDLTIVKHIVGTIPNKVKTAHVIKNDVGQPASLTAVLGTKPVVVLSVSGQHCDKISGVSIHGSLGSASLYNAMDDHITVRTAAGQEKIPISTMFPLYLELKEFTEYLHGGPPPRCNLQNAKEVMCVILKLRKKAGL